MEIGYLIKKERLRNKLSQEEVAKAIDSTKQAVYKYENGIVTNIPMDKIEKMAQLFCVSPAYLMGWEDDETVSPSETELTEGEKVLLELFRMLPDEAQKMYLEVLRNSLKKQS